MIPIIEQCRPDAVYHLAALTHVGESWDSPNEVIRTNVLGTASLLAALRSAAPEAAVLVVSSAEVYGIVRARDLPIAESSPLAPVTPYAASKAGAEQVAMQAWRGYGQRVIVVRPFNHIGPRQAPTFAVSAIARRVVTARRTGRTTLSVGTISTRRDFTDVRDVVQAYRLLVTSGALGQTFNVCSGQDVSVAEIIDRLLALSGLELEIQPDPELVRPVDLPVLRGSFSQLQEVTGWKPTIPLDETLRDVLDYWEDQAEREETSSPTS